MAKKSALQKIQETVVETVKGVVKDPAGAAGKAAEHAKGAFAVGKMMAEQVTKSAGRKAAEVSGLRSEPPVPPREDLHEKSAEVTPIDVARVVAKKPPAQRPMPAKKAPARKASSPSAKLPPRKPVEEAPAKKAAAKKAPAKKAAAKKAPAKKAPAKKTPGASEKG